MSNVSEFIYSAVVVDTLDLSWTSKKELVAIN